MASLGNGERHISQSPQRDKLHFGFNNPANPS